MKSILKTAFADVVYLAAFIFCPIWILGSLFFTLMDKPFNWLSLKIWGISICLFLIMAIIEAVKEARTIKK